MMHGQKNIKLGVVDLGKVHFKVMCARFWWTMLQHYVW